MKTLRARSKIWLEVDGKPLLGNGREELLEAIAAHGSINAAARQLGLGYRRAWGTISSMEAQLGEALVLREKGGVTGGRALLTARAHELLARFKLLKDGMQESVDTRFSRIFADGSKEKEAQQ